MARVKIGTAPPDQHTLDVEIARLRDFDIDNLRRRWRTAFGKPPPHLSRHLLYRILAYRLQAEHLGGLDPEIRCLLKKAASTTADLDQIATDLGRMQVTMKPGTLLTREWNGHLQQVMVLADGFSWKGKTYPSLSGVASAITGSRWNGPRFFGLRDKPNIPATP